jgi:O-antigen/teichoic acid export membrane protein
MSNSEVTPSIISENETQNALIEPELEATTVKHRSVRGVLAYATRTFALQAIGFIANLVISAYILPEEYGVYYIVLSLLGLFTFLSDIGLAATLIQKKEPPTLKELRTTFTVQMGLAAVIGAILIGLTPLWQQTQSFTSKELLLLYALVASFLFASLKTIPSILLERELLFDKKVIPEIVENLVFYMLVPILAWQGFGITSFTIAVLARSLVGVITMYSIKSWSIGFAFDRATLKPLVKFGFRFQLNDLLARIKDDLFIVFLGTWLGKTEMGYVSWAKNQSRYPYQLTVSSVMAVSFPTYSRIQNNPPLLKKAIEKSIYFISLGSFPLLVGMAVYIFPLLEVIPQYSRWQPAALSLSLFAIGIAVSAISTPLTNALMAIGQINKSLHLMIVWTVLTWVVTPICLKFFGYQGVAIASLLIATTTIVLPVWLLYRVVKFDLWGNITTQLIATIGLALIGYVGMEIWSRSLLHLLLGMIIGGGGFVVLFLLIGWRRFFSEVRSLGIGLGALQKWRHSA